MSPEQQWLFGQSAVAVILIFGIGYLIKEIVKKDKIIVTKEAENRALNDAVNDNLKEQIAYTRAQEGKMTNTLVNLVAINEEMNDSIDELNDRLK